MKTAVSVWIESVYQAKNKIHFDLFVSIIHCDSPSSVCINGLSQNQRRARIYVNLQNLCVCVLCAMCVYRLPVTVLSIASDIADKNDMPLSDSTQYRKSIPNAYTKITYSVEFVQPGTLTQQKQKTNINRTKYRITT